MKKRILIIHDYPHCEGGGVEVQGFLDAKELVARGHEVTIASTRKTSETYAGEFTSSKDGVNFAVVNSIEELSLLVHGSDAVHVRATFSLRSGTMQALELLNNKKKPHVISVHTNYKHVYFGALNDKTESEKTQLISKFAEYLSSPYSIIVSPSLSLRESLEAIGVRKDFTVVHNAKNWEDFSTTKNAKKIEMSDLLYIGEISSMKGVHTLLGAIVLLKKKLPNIKVRFVGTGTSHKECGSLVSALGLEQNIDYLGHIENKNIPDYLSRTKVLVLPSLTESWGNVVMEAMGLGVKTISSRVEGLIELTKDGMLGFQFEVGNPEDLARIVRGVLCNRISLPVSVSKIKNFVRKNHTLKKRVDKLMTLYQLV